MTADADVFLDSNILLYAAGGRTQAPAKHERALEVLTENFAISAQVLAEFYVNAIRKGPSPLSSDVAKLWVDTLSRKPCQTVDPELLRAGIDISRRYQTSYWDGAIIAAAERLGCAILYTEDLNDGQTYGSVTVVNPFLRK